MKLTDPAIAIDVRVKEAKALGKSKDPRALDVLLDGLDIRHDKLHDAIVQSLKEQKADAALAARVADSKRSPASRLLAMRGLRTLKPESAVPALVVALDDKDDTIRADAAQTLAVFGAALAEERLIKAMTSDASKDVRYYAAVALGGVKTKAAKDAVSARLKIEPDLVVQDALDQAQVRQNAPQP